MTPQGRELVRRRLRDDIDAVGERVVAAVADEIPVYAEMGATQVQETRAIARWAIGRLVDLWVDDARLTPHDLRRFRGIGVSRANDGRPLFAVLRAYRVAAVEASDALVALGADLQMDDIVALNRVLLTSVDQLSEALFAGYTSGSERLASDRDAMLGRLFDDMVAGRQTSSAALADRATQLGLTVPTTASLLLVRRSDREASVSDDELAELTAAVVSAGPADDHHTPMVLRRRGPGSAAVLAPAFDAVAVALAQRSLLGCVVEGFDVADVPGVHRLASVALERAPDEAFDRTPLLDRGDALVVALLHRQPDVEQGAVAREVLGALLRTENRHLLDGLSAFMAHGSAVGAADWLGLHPQTMRHRMRRVTAVTGREPRRAWDRLVLDMARTEAVIARST